MIQQLVLLLLVWGTATGVHAAPPNPLIRLLRQPPRLPRDPPSSPLFPSAPNQPQRPANPARSPPPKPTTLRPPPRPRSGRDKSKATTGGILFSDEYTVAYSLDGEYQ
ncbi:hypothetical protein VOLCADRAFT_89010 [Volvox carteri f. nagariensis]|uniref:Uncharacterized protein n=1 Tax=Volvox carteri f. nagariensis TaxID=3068 RepID=D8TQJ7_VOLCA|nr:uncharacterized protein VOLCADRAFT_89010 [Volvox carteri f. nagariensis]EFJ50165.1 hypothetical protein VOLCADRAFT_89010 [Volvox carteri f. nagariensis]|eukprot:XP_002948785.1 hypothetical protein VOLCADRAFT_89010 [Volvox carteri f. nagariensis]